MERLGLNEIRENFLSFFEGKGHLRQPSFPLIPQGDNSLMLINSGMAPLKPYFSGEAVPPRKRMTTCQKCIRTPDIERVGKTSRHGTFFEMLGNFSFGDYFKREAISWAWEFITKQMKIPVDRLHVSVYLDDDEAYDIWTGEIGVDPSHMVRLGKEDNFWEIGAGPCGPSSEIYFDRGERYSCGKDTCAVGCDCDRYVEFWNLVFTQFNNDGEGNYTPLRQKNIDTGMGLERIACIMQGVESLFDVDTIMNITRHISRIAGVTYGQGEKSDVSLRVVTDHVRSTVMMICDGVLPSNEGRGYVLRRLLRRAARHGKLLGIKEPFLYQVCDTVVAESGQAYPELIEKQDYIRRVIRIEEENFDKTIDAGTGMLLDLADKLETEGKTVLSGEDAFRLYDTYGFPLDLTVEMLAERGMRVDEAGFTQEMDAQKRRARQARAKLGDLGWTGIELGLDKSEKTEFIGYTRMSGSAAVLAIVSGGALAQTVSEGESVSIVLNRTPFYAESGGQVADTGMLENESGRVRIENVQKSGDGKFLHIGTVVSGEMKAGDKVEAKVDVPRRRAVMRAHSATHLLQKALREVLGDHVHQAGSLVEPDRFRFDFTHFTAMSEEETARVTQRVNEKILEGMKVSVREMPIEEAKKSGATALFGEKYGDIVRVVRMGDFSVEFCGGTHLDDTAKVGPFVIESESSVAAGVRRIEGRVGTAVLEEMQENKKLIGTVSEMIKTNPHDLLSRVQQLMEENKAARQEAERLRAQALASQAQQYLEQAAPVGGLKVIAARFEGLSSDALRSMGDAMKDKDESVAAVLASVDDEKVTFLAVCGKAAVAAGIKAGELIREVTKIAGGSGGGRPDSAMGGGKDPSKVGQALISVESFVKSKAL